MFALFSIFNANPYKPYIVIIIVSYNIMIDLTKFLSPTENITKDILGLRISEGMSPGTFRDIIDRMVRGRVTNLPGEANRTS